MSKTNIKKTRATKCVSVSLSEWEGEPRGINGHARGHSQALFQPRNCPQGSFL